MRGFRLLPALVALPAFSAAAQTPTLLADQASVECLYHLTYQRDLINAKTRTEMLRLRLGSKLSRRKN